MIYKVTIFLKTSDALHLVDWWFSDDYDAAVSEGKRRKSGNPDYRVFVQTLSCTAVEAL